VATAPGSRGAALTLAARTGTARRQQSRRLTTRRRVRGLFLSFMPSRTSTGRANAYIAGRLHHLHVAPMWQNLRPQERDGCIGGGPKHAGACRASIGRSNPGRNCGRFRRESSINRCRSSSCKMVHWVMHKHLHRLRSVRDAGRLTDCRLACRQGRRWRAGALRLTPVLGNSVQQ
jgi:hypothetical protein